MNGFQHIGEAIASAFGAVLSDDGTRSLLWLLAFVFLWSGSAKLRNPERAAWALVDFGVARRVHVARGIAVATVEVATGAALIVGAVVGGVIAMTSAGAAALLFAAFVVLIARSLAKGEQFECFCFGEGSGRLSTRTLGRAFVLAVIAITVVVQAGGLPIASAVEDALLPGVIAVSALSGAALIATIPNLVRWNARPFAIDESHYVQRLER